jgi:quercetin dioxygenase-like cupin family protein
MRRVSTIAFVWLLAGSPAGAIQAAQAPGEPDPGVRPTRLLDRAEVRASRVDLQPGAVRRAHTHDDVEYHLWIPVSGSLEITVGADRPAAAAPGQGFFMTRGTLHTFRNTGAGPAAVLEIFVKRATTARSARDLLDLAALFVDPSAR